MFDNTDININDLYHNIPKDILFVIENSNCDYKIEDIIGKYDNGDCFIDVLLYDLLNYCDNLKDLLEMFFEKDKWYKLREKYLHREEGKYNYNLYLKYCCLQK